MEDSMRLSGRVAIVTGAGRGIGAAIAKGLAAEGAAVVVNYSRSAKEAECVSREVIDAGGQAVPLQADIKDLASHERIVSTALEQFGRIDILVNNAGIEFREPFLEATQENWDLTLGVNLKGVYFLSQKVASAMRASGGGKILNISSIHDEVPIRNLSIYSITKGGMKMLTKSLAMELAEYKINVNSLSPGAILTDMNREALSDPAYRTRVVEKIPWRRIGDVGDLMGAAVFLCSGESDYVTGVTLYVDGGILL
jgi:glucose 1-dehydrogenase